MAKSSATIGISKKHKKIASAQNGTGTVKLILGVFLLVTQ